MYIFYNPDSLNTRYSYVHGQTDHRQPLRYACMTIQRHTCI